jgi:hypothetical protein
MDNIISNDELYSYMNKFDIFHVDDWYEELINPSKILPYCKFVNMIINDKFVIKNNKNNMMNDKIKNNKIGMMNDKNNIMNDKIKNIKNNKIKNNDNLTNII